MPTIALMMLSVCATAALAAHEALPYGDLEYMASSEDGARAVPVWARAGQPCHAVGWIVSRTNAASGEVCVRGSVAGEEFVVAGEGSGGALAGSVMLRAEAPTQATVRLSWFNRLSRADETITVGLTAEWQQFRITATADAGGAVELAVAPVGEAVIYADDFSLQCPGPPGNEVIADPTPAPRRPVTLEHLQDYSGAAVGGTGSVPLTLAFPEGAEPLVPYVWGGIPFPKGEVFDRRCLRVVDSDGDAVPAQFDVLARWHGDRSIQAVLVTLPVGCGPNVRLEWTPRPHAAQETAAPPGQPDAFERALWPVVVALDGTSLPGEEPQWRVTERSGPLCTVTATRRRFGPVTVEARVSVFAGSSRALVDYCFINEGERVAVRRLGAVAEAPVSVRDVAKNELALTADGRGVFGWPSEVGAVVLSQGLARTLSLMVDLEAEGALPEYATARLPLLTAPAEWYCNAGVFGLLMPPDPESFPIFESTLGGFETLGSFSWARKARGKLYGWFNFGDAPGDGGWSNLETMADHEIFLHWFRTLSREHFDNARLAAEHYRDVDIDHRYGYCHTHCNNHTASGEDWSHAWIQGIRDLYILTGDGRSLAVLGEVGERLLTKDPGFTTGRDWTRAIHNLVDIYQATGDRRHLDAVMAHIKALGERQEPETGVCGAEKGSWYENRYAAGSAFTWYGCLAMAHLHQNVGGDELRDIFLRELDLSLDVEKKGKACYVYLPDEQVCEDERAAVIGVYTLGRGSVLFPALGYAYKLTGDEQYLRIGMDVLAHCLLNQRSGSDNAATSFITAFLREARAAGWGAAQEAEAFARAREFSWARHPRELVNGGFEDDSFAGWDIKKVPGQDFYWDPIVRVGYYLDGEVKLAGDRSLRIRSENRRRVISSATRVALPAGRRWRASVWVRADETMNPTASWGLRSYEGLPGAGGSLRPTGEKRAGWHERAAEFVTLGRMVLSITVGNRTGTGDVWFDEAALEDLGETGLLLTENGVGHEGREPPEGAYILTGGSYLPDEPMAGDVVKDGPILFTEGALTDGDDSYDYSRHPCSYAYWQGRERGEILFDLVAPYRVLRVALRVNCDTGRRVHGTSKIELLPADTDEPIAVIEEPVDGWNSFDDLDLTVQKLRLRLHQLDNRPYITVSEVRIWGKGRD